MISLRASTLSLLGLLVALAGCSAQSGAAGSAESAGTVQATDSTATTTPSPVLLQQASFHKRGGQAFLLQAALREPINLTAAQKTTIEAALAESVSKAPSADHQARMTALAASVRAGKVDATAQASNDVAAMNAHIAASAKAVNTLYTTLTPEQRRALVDAVSSRMDHKGAPSGAARTHRSHAHADGDHADRGDHGPMGGLLAGLDLTKAQEDAIHAKMAAQKPVVDHEAMKKQFEGLHAARLARLQTFASDHFDATAFVTPPAGMMNSGHADRMATDLAIITSVLEPAQREKLATRLEQRARSVVAPPAVNQKASPAL